MGRRLDDETGVGKGEEEEEGEVLEEEEKAEQQ